ncbi:MAG: MBG domain-containing protein [Verrucomicrobia bacterium]|nr:MBG domain-containing protein [Verrucomicrobiota bacterium]
MDSLRNNGGKTSTHALLTGSPAINGVTSSNFVTIDQRGIQRPQGSAADIGAFELEVTMLNQTIAFAGIADQVATATVTLSATASSGLPVSFAVTGPAVLEGSILRFTGAGQVSVTATQAGDATWTAAPAVTRTFNVTRANASVTLSGLQRSFDGTAQPVSAVTNPAGLNVVITYDGSTTVPSAVGNYSVVATIDEPLYQGSATATLVIEVQVSAEPTIEIEFDPTLDIQSGLFQSLVVVKNPSERPITGIALRIRGLPDDVQVYNASIEDGIPTIYWSFTIPPGENVQLTVYYFRPNRNPDFNPIYELESITPPPPASVSDEGNTDYIDLTVRVWNGSVVLDWFATPGQSYAMEYSNDGRNWTRIQTTFKAVGNQLRWIDSGPPQTSARPLDSESRFYRVYRINP